MNNQALDLNQGRLEQFLQLKAELFEPPGVVFDVVENLPDRLLRESLVSGADLMSGQGGTAALGHHDADQCGNDLFKVGHSRRKLFDFSLQPLDLALVGFPAHGAIVTRPQVRRGPAPNELEAGKGGEHA